MTIEKSEIIPWCIKYAWTIENLMRTREEIITEFASLINYLIDLIERITNAFEWLFTIR